MTKYVRNEDGAVHSVTDEHFENVLHEESKNGNKYLLHGWEEITPAQAKKASPQLFGAIDPTIVLTPKERMDARERMKWDAELAAENAAAGTEDTE